ncbi:activating signal cointegrator 1 [Fopius arisanus]|uniref:Activating signal cointegrator 1 n=2 Tax=Fopius arisanus TaxID=64838 RepID=A0A0C9R7G9_9HYME|nr:PREDICTED: activating signal cointegrator 1 [Fopius arisanus]
MDRWIHQSLSGLLDYPVSEEMIQYMMTIENERDLDDFFKNFLDLNNSKHKNFIFELKRKKAQENKFTGYRKSSDIDSCSQKSKDKKKLKSKEKEVVEVPETSKSERPDKKKKFVNLYSVKGNNIAVFLKGRVKCDCEAKTHKLINNCLTCGRIVCEQEGAGPCFFCGELVCTPNQQNVLSTNSKNSDNLYNKLMEQKPSKAALKQRDKLLEFDRNSAKRTRVIDDESDYYQSSNSVWLSKEERAEMERREAEMKERKYGSRLEKKFTVDIFGRQVVEEEDDSEEIFKRQLEALETSGGIAERALDLICPTFQFDRPVYMEGDLSVNIPLNKNEPMIHRVQDKQLLEMVDEGLCLSMHQPYASLLISRIKKHEGRTWYSSHRGRLWIHAASKTPSTEEVSSLEHRYRVLVNQNIKFPKEYPTKVLLGYVTVVDVLPQDEYRKIYPEGESDSPYVFICDDFYELPIKFPMPGKMKIYKLDKKIHQAALKCAERFSKVNKE